MSKIDELEVTVKLEQINPDNAPHIEIKQNGMLTEIFVDGRKINGVRKVSFEYSCDNLLPVLKLDLLATDMAVDATLVPELPEVFKPFYKKVQDINN